VQYIADLTRLDYVIVGRIAENGDATVQTIAVSAFGKLADNFYLCTARWACEQVIRGTLYSYPNGCKKSFPNSGTIAQFNVEGYIGYPLFDEKGAAVGLIAVMHEQPIEDEETVSSVYKNSAKRAEIELVRIKYEEQLEQTNKILKKKTCSSERSPGA
jgi:hypothetical protein